MWQRTQSEWAVHGTYILYYIYVHMYGYLSLSLSLSISLYVCMVIVSSTQSLVHDTSCGSWCSLYRATGPA